MKIIRTPPVPRKLNSYRRRCSQAKVVSDAPRGVKFVLAGLRPLVPLPTVCACLDRKTRKVLALIDDGKLRWVFDIRSAKSRRREIRIARQSLLQFAGLCDRNWLPEGDEGEFAELMDQILPTEKTTTITLGPAGIAHPVMRGTDIAECFTCLSQHILNLIQEHSLQIIQSPHKPKATPLVTRASVIQFLRNRRMK